MLCSFSYWYHCDGNVLFPVLNSLKYRCERSGQWIAESTHNPQVLSMACSTDTTARLCASGGLRRKAEVLMWLLSLTPFKRSIRNAGCHHSWHKLKTLPRWVVLCRWSIKSAWKLRKSHCNYFRLLKSSPQQCCCNLPCYSEKSVHLFVDNISIYKKLNVLLCFPFTKTDIIYLCVTPGGQYMQIQLQATMRRDKWWFFEHKQ